MAINPGYSRNADELDTTIFKEILDGNLNMFDKNEGAKLFDQKGIELNGKNVPFRYSSVSEWWEKVFEEILIDKHKNDFDKDLLQKSWSV